MKAKEDRTVYRCMDCGTYYSSDIPVCDCGGTTEPVSDELPFFNIPSWLVAALCGLGALAWFLT